MERDVSIKRVADRTHAGNRAEDAVLRVEVTDWSPPTGAKYDPQRHPPVGVAAIDGAGEGLFRAIVELAPDATLVVGHDGRIALANLQTETLFGYPRAELLGRPVELLIPKRFHASHRRHRAAYARAPRLRPMGVDLRLFGRRRDGSEFPIEVSLSPLPSTDGQTGDDVANHARARSGGVICSVRDITERLRLESARAASEASNTQLQSLQALSDAALSHLDLDALLPALLDRVLALLRADTGAVLLLDVAGANMTARAVRGLWIGDYAGLFFPMGHGIAGRIAASQVPLVVDDTSAVDVANPILREIARSTAGVPLLVEGQLVGVLCVGSATPRHFSEADVQLLRLVADRVALAVDRARLYEAERDARTRAEAALIRAALSEVTAAKQAEELQRILETMADAVVVYDQKGRLIRANRAHRELFALDRAPPGFDTLSAVERARLLETRDATGVPLAPEHYPIVRALRGEVVTGPDADVRMRAFDGRELDINCCGSPLLDGEGQVAGAVIVSSDTTWRLHLERDREEASAQALASREFNQRMEEFLATAAHDVRTPLSAATGFISLAQSRFERLVSAVREQNPALDRLIETVRGSLEDADRGVERLSRLVTVLFDTAALRAGKLELHRALCDLAGLAREQVEWQRMAAPHRTILLHTPSDEPLPIEADADRIGRVIGNYLTNALKYSHADRPVDVTASVSVQSGNGDGERPVRVARVAVRDKGPGLPEVERARVWEAFHRAPGVKARGSAGDSLGLGLHVCKAIVEAHGGAVGVESAVGRGSTFWFTLPLASTAVRAH
jgi:PAS domain S-box-containing protein